MKRRDFFKKSFYLGSGTAIGSILSAGLVWKPQKLLAVPPNENKLIRTRCGSVQTWDYVNTPPANLYHDAVNYPVVEDMLDQAICSLTANTNVVNAWQDIINYQPGETIAIKLNLNCWETDTDDKNRPNQTYQMTNAIIRSLLLLGVPLSNMTVYDVSRDRVIRMQNGMDSAGYAGIDYVYRDNTTSFWNDSATMYFPQSNVTRRYPNALTDADHLINIVLMKGHGSYITGALKNHFGTIEGNSPNGASRSNIHEPNRQYNIPLLCSHTEIKDKCRLNICEAFFMAYFKETTIYEACIDTAFFPAGISGNPSPNSILVSKNPVVMDSILHDLIVRERNVRRAANPSDPNLREPFTTSFLEHANTMQLGIFEQGVIGSDDVSYSQIDYSRIDMPLMDKVVVDRALRDFKNGTIDQVQVLTKVQRLENGW